jgi:NADH-quinone oxidoreductase subunit J
MVELALFYAFAGVMIFSAVLMVTSRNIFHSALFLALSLLCVAALFALLGSFFIAGIQVLIYIGAVVVLTIFVINLTKQVIGRDTPQVNQHVFLAVITSLVSACLIILAVLKTGWGTIFLESVAKSERTDNIPLIGRKLLTDFVLPFEVVSVLLLATLIGAIAIISRDKGGQGRGEGK